MQWTTNNIDLAGLVIDLERLECRLQNGERSAKLQMEAMQILHAVSNAAFIQQNWRQEITDRIRHIMQACDRDEKTEAE